MSMELDPDEVFGDEEDDPETEFFKEREATKELLVYLVDASPKMFSTTCPSDDEKTATHFQVAINSIAQSLKSQIINRSYDEVSICFFNTREKKNLQDLSGVYVFNVPEREDLDRPTARLIKEFDLIEERFVKDIGSKYGIVPGSRENSLYNALWVAQALLRKGSAKTADKRILLFTNEDDPFGNLKGVVKVDMMRTTLQRAKDAQDLGIAIELLPLSQPDDEFNVSLFYADLLGLEGDDLAQFKALVGERFEDLKDQLRKRIFKKRRVRRLRLVIFNGLSIELNTYALIRPTNPGRITWLDSMTNLPLKGKLNTVSPLQGSSRNENENIMFSVAELSEVKRVSTGHLRLLGFKPLTCLKDYHNLKPATFVFPSDEEVIGGTCLFVALHRSMVRLKRFAVAFYGSSSHPQLVALVAQLHTDPNSAPHATDDQIKKASALVKRIDLKDFSVCQFANPALQRHYAVLQALALDEDEMPEIKDETLPDEEGMARPGIVKALEEFKLSVYGENYEEEDSNIEGKVEPTRKRKANAMKEYGNYDWADLADNGKLKDLTVVELKYYLGAHNLPVTGKKEVLISRILTHMAVYVDDILLAGDSVAELDSLKLFLDDQFKIKDLAEAAYRALGKVVAEVSWLIYLLADFGVCISHLIPVYCESHASLHITRNFVFHERTKHIEIDCHYVRDCVNAGLCLPASCLFC
ncbi:ATP-dependent DNA helicase 2 subunit KU70 [Capsicum baccatum]|uniref:DNA helicase n=1 Tax=Capsicum baccatum TaxID=33114 RepID=A0A2G2W1W9_CAPBA|nr:ATP-dependent DNA helicase 2 subunit KU70 [Capsicum baccatum]